LRVERESTAQGGGRVPPPSGAHEMAESKDWPKAARGMCSPGNGVRACARVRATATYVTLVGAGGALTTPSLASSLPAAGTVRSADEGGEGKVLQEAMSAGGQAVHMNSLGRYAEATSCRQYNLKSPEYDVSTSTKIWCRNAEE
jgi:hypothetical protein